MNALADRTAQRVIRNIVSTILLAAAPAAYGCINEYSTLLSGEVFMGEGTTAHSPPTSSAQRSWP